jgi:two-component sensor histidine kinase
MVAAGALAFDAVTPEVISVTLFYVAVVLIGFWFPQPKAALALGLLATPLIIIGYWITIPESEFSWGGWEGVMNRGLSIATVWLTAVFVWHIRVLEQVRKQDEAQILVLADEAEHRAKNLLTNVGAMVQLSQADTPDGLKKAIAGRIAALANVHSLFAQSRWAGAELGSLVKQELSPYSRDGEMRSRIYGPSVMLSPDVAQSLAVTLHELATNAAKYGALSVAEGQVRVEWSRAEDGQLVVRWTEAGGPTVKPPTRKGFGTRVIESMIRDGVKGRVQVDWRAEGLACEIAFPT